MGKINMNEPADEQELSFDPNWEDTEASKKLTGVFANRIYVQHLGEGMLRLNFGEVLDPHDPTYHTALVISGANAKLFAELIYRMGDAAITPQKMPAPEGQQDG
jgi:hypothetical protein